MENGLAGRRILVTGAAGGIGSACVVRFIGAGARVGCLDADQDGLAALSGQASPDQLFCRTVDIANAQAVRDAVDRCADWATGLDGVVNAAGMDLVAPAEQTTDEDWRQVMAVNLDGPMFACRAALPHLRAAGGGSIVNVSSGAGLQPLPGRSAYSASKAGLQMYSKALAMEWAEHGIRVNCVCPGAADTQMFRSGLSATENPAAERAKVVARYALGRIAEPDEIAAAVHWLTSSEASFVTGSVLAVDGGRTFH